MPQLYAQTASRPDPWLLGRTSAGLCTLQTACPLTVTYSGGSPVPDTIAAGSAATVYGGSAATFDASADVWVVLTVPGSGALQVTKEADLATVSGDWAGLARVVQHSTEPYQPQAYLASGGLGAPSGSSVTIVSALTAKARSLWTGSANSAPPAGWQTSGYDDSAWTAATHPAAPAPPTGPVPPGADNLWAEAPTASSSEQVLIRQAFALPAGTITSAALEVNCQYIKAVYVNGTLIGGGTPPSVSSISTDVTAALLAGQTNHLACWWTNEVAAAAQAYGRFDLVVSYAGASSFVTSASPTEGDLLYYHSGAWTDLPIGTAGQELTVVSGDPAWATPAAGYSDPLTTKGDLLTRSSSATVRLGVGSNGQVVTADSTAADGITWATPASGSVTSVALAGPTGTTVSGSPVTSSGTLTLSWASQSANTFLGAPNGSSGAPTFRVLAAGDIPSLPASQITSGQLATARGGTGVDGASAANGALLIGTGSGYSLATLTAGSGVTITNGSGTITIASSGGGGSGTVTSVALTVPSFLSVSGSPVTSSGTLAVTLANENAATVFAGPTSGSAAAPTFRALQGSDLPPAAAAGGHIHAHGHFL